LPFVLLALKHTRRSVGRCFADAGKQASTHANERVCDVRTATDCILRRVRHLRTRSFCLSLISYTAPHHMRQTHCRRWRLSPPTPHHTTCFTPFAEDGEATGSAGPAEEPASLQFKDTNDSAGGAKYRTDGLSDDDSDNSDGWIVNDGEVRARWCNDCLTLTVCVCVCVCVRARVRV
jgi:hypothetical protein